VSNLYDSARDGFLRGEIVWKVDGSIIKAALVRGYNYSVSHQHMSDVAGAGGTVVAETTLSSLTTSGGAADAADAVFQEVPEGAAIPHIVIFQASAVEGGDDVPASQQRLIALIDRGPGIPVLPNGQDITVRWSPGSDRIFRI